MLSYSVTSSSMVKADDIDLSYNHTDFAINFLGKETKISVDLPWVYNVYNTLAAIASWLVLWVDQEKIAESLKSFAWVVGRMEPVEHNWVRYFVDFAHTPNALKSALSYINAIKWDGKNIVVFGAPGNRDRYKRPEMGKIADQLADVVIVTDDDPDTESRLSIIQEVTKGISRDIGEREYAIKMAVEVAKPWDMVLLAGKWHEHVQLTNFGKRKRSDKAVLEGILGIEWGKE
jgi:UDP-N-acetylmuramoyl-L-alanyl-D-glutamate--2,6-diaminopimelate ligase